MVESSKQTENDDDEFEIILAGDTKANSLIEYDKEWDDEEYFKIPKNILKGIYVLNYKQPQKIQAQAIPLMQKQDKDGKYEHLITQSKCRSGKTGACVIGSVLRVDPSINKVQVIVVGPTRECLNQITSLFYAVTQFAQEYQVCNLVDHTGPVNAQIVVSTLGKIQQCLGGRGPQRLDLSELRCFVIDEADFFFSDIKNTADMQTLRSTLLLKKLNYQYILFSMTYSENLNSVIKQFIETANYIRVKVEELYPNNTQQYEYECEPYRKIDFLMSIFKYMKMTQTLVFVNTKSYAETLHEILRKNNYQTYIMLGEMSKEEKDETMYKFRDNQINVLISTNLLTRGFEIEGVFFVVNYDVPKMKIDGKWVADDGTYLRRIGKTERFHNKVLALTLYDNDDDKNLYHEILEKLKIKDKNRQLKGPEEVGQILKSIIQ